MSEIVVESVAVTRSGQAIPRVEKNQAISLLVPFEKIKHLLGGMPAPRRPNRNRPVLLADAKLRDELEAWEAASDEAFEAIEADLPEQPE